MGSVFTLSLALAPGGGIYGSTGLSIPVSVHSADIYQTEVAKAEEGYLTFWFNPNSVSLPEPDPNLWPLGTLLSIAEVVNSDKRWPLLAALYVRRPPGQGYQAHLSKPRYSRGTEKCLFLLVRIGISLLGQPYRRYILSYDLTGQGMRLSLTSGT